MYLRFHSNHLIVQALTFHSNDKHTLCRLPGGIISCVYNFSVTERELRAWCMRAHQDWVASVVCWSWVGEANRCEGLSWVRFNCGASRTGGKHRRHVLCKTTHKEIIIFDKLQFTKSYHFFRDYRQNQCEWWGWKKTSWNFFLPIRGVVVRRPRSFKKQLIGILEKNYTKSTLIWIFPREMNDLQKNIILTSSFPNI